jgi:N-acetylglucosamine transport system permease protein
MFGILGNTQAPGASLMSIVGTGLIVYCLISIAILWAHARTRLYPLYLLKICWVSFTFIGFFWLISMSFADPGPRHGGVASEFMKNPAGPFAALGNYTRLGAEFYAASPWFALLLFGLLLLWRGLVGHRSSDEDGARRRVLTKAFLTASAVGMCGALFLLDHGRAPTRLQYTGSAFFAAACVLWAALPLTFKRRSSPVALLILGSLAAAPAVASLARFNWGSYVYAVSNYTFAWKTARMGSYMLNSLMVSVLTVGITSLCASMAAYALARFEFVGRNAVLFGFIGAMVIPAQLYIVPLFLMVQSWHVTAGGVHFSFMDSRLGLSLIYAATGLPFAIFLLTGFYRTLPGALREAAAIDGCGERRIFTDVYFPLAAPGMATAAIFQFLGVWNEYQFALIFLTNEKLKTLPVGLYNLSVSQQYAANWSALFAGVTILCLPTFLIFVTLQERIVAGLTVGAVKE